MDSFLPFAVGVLALIGATIYFLRWRILGTFTRLTHKKSSVAVKGSKDKQNGLGVIRRHPSAIDRLTDRWASGERTLYEVFQHGVSTSGDLPCLGHRNGKKPSKTESGFDWLSYKEVNQRAQWFGSGLIALELVNEIEGDEVTGPIRVLGFMAKNCPEWVIAEHGLFKQRGVTVPMYVESSTDVLEQVIEEVGFSTVLVTPENIEKLAEVAPKCKSFKNIIVIGDASAAKAKAGSLNVIAFEDVLKKGQESPLQDKPPSGDDVATFCYTSGTTGKPKGALLSHNSITADLAGFQQAAGFEMSQKDIHLSYLPLPHVFERLAQALVFYHGGRIGFFQGDLRKVAEDLRALRPTILPSVPRFLCKTEEKVMEGVEKNPVANVMFKVAFCIKSALLHTFGFLHNPILDALVFNKIARKVGLDRCRVILSSSAPIEPKLLNWLRIVFSMPVVEGYGQTETSAGATTMEVSDLGIGTVGIPLSCCEIRLISVDKPVKYSITDRSHNGQACSGRGEILFRGPNMFKGYFKMADKTAETIDKDGWVHSGDIGIWTPDGKLKLVDRKNSVLKLSQGEYVQPEHIEKVLGDCPSINQIFVYGESNKSNVVCVVVPKDGKKDEKALLEEMQKVGKSKGLKAYEIPAAVYVEEKAWTENDLITPTQKLKRKAAADKYQKELEALYSKAGEKRPK